MQNTNWAKIAGVVVLTIVVSLLTVKLSGSSTNSVRDSVANKVISSGEIRIGYIVYNPYLYKDEETGKLAGFSYDIVEAAAKKLNLKTNWIEEVGWGTAIQGLKTGRYDIVGTQMWANSSRAREAVFSIAPMNSVIYPYVKAGDTRFSDLSKINSNKVTVVALDGDLAINITNEDYPMAKLVTLPQTASVSDEMLNIIDGKADISFIDSGGAAVFTKSNPGKIERVGNIPVRTFGNAFAFARGEESMISMWNVALGELLNDGTIARILEKYNVSNNFSINK